MFGVMLYQVKGSREWLICIQGGVLWVYDICYGVFVEDIIEVYYFVFIGSYYKYENIDYCCDDIELLYFEGDQFYC